MKVKIVLIITFLLYVVFVCSAQKINSEKTFGGGYKFTQNGEKLRMNELTTKISGDLEALNLIRSAKTKLGIGRVLAGIGGLLVGLSLNNAIRGEVEGSSNRILAGGGAVVVGIGLITENRGYKQVREAVRIYNRQLENSSGSKFKPKFQAAASRQGIGFFVNF